MILMTVVNVRIILPALLSWNIHRVIRYFTPEEYAEVFLNNLSGSQMLTFLACEYLWLCERFEIFLTKSESYSLMLDGYSVIGDGHDVLEIDGYQNRLDDWLCNDVALKALEDLKVYQTELEVDVMNCVALQRLLIERAMVQERELLHHILKFSTDILVARVDGLVHDLESVVPRNRLMIQYVPSRLDRVALHKSLIKTRQMQLEFRTKRIPRLESIILWEDLHETIMGMASLSSTAWSFGNFRARLIEVGNNLLDSGNDVRRSRACLLRMWTLLSSSKAHFGIDMMIHLEKFCQVRGNTTEVRTDLAALLRVTKTLDSIDQHQLPYSNLQGDRFQRYVEIAKKMNQLEQESTDIVHGAPDMLGENFLRELHRVNSNSSEGILYLVVFGYSASVLKCMEYSGKFLKSIKARIFLFGEANYGNFNTKLMRYELHNLSREMQSVSTFIGADQFFLSQINSGDRVLLVAGTEVFDLQMQRLYHTTGCQSRLEWLVKKLRAKKEVLFETWVIASDYKVYQSFPDTLSEFGEEFFRDHYLRMEVFDMKTNQVDNLLITNGDVFENGCIR